MSGCANTDHFYRVCTGEGIVDFANGGSCDIPTGPYGLPEKHTIQAFPENLQDAVKKPRV